MNWNDWLLFLLCELYKRSGGDCADLQNNPEIAITLLEQIVQNPPPAPARAAGQDDPLRRAMNALDAHLEMTQNALTPDLTLRARIVNAKMRQLFP